MSKQRSFLILILILIVAALLRFIGTNPGYPPIHTDEGITHSQGIAMILEKTLDPKHGYGLPYNYPIVVPLINAIFYLFLFIPISILGYLISHFGEIGNLLSAGSVLSGIFDHNILGINRINVVFWGRYVTALFGVGIVFLSYLLAKQLFKSNVVGFLAAFFAAINYRLVLNSHFGLPDIYNAFFLLVALYLINKLWIKQSRINYILAGISVAVFFSTKFQFFALPPLLFVLFCIALNERKREGYFRFFFNINIFLIIGVLIVTVLLLNFYHILHLKETFEQVGYSALKYRYGRSELDFYPLSYLYNIGIGQIMSLVVVWGMVLSLKKSFQKMLFLLSVTAPFFWMMVYYTGGGFYTRNFVTIIPVLLIYGAYGLYSTVDNFRKGYPFLAFTLGALVIAVISYQSLKNSFIVPLEYSKNWNVTDLQNWLGKNLASGTVIKTHPSMVLPQKKFKVIKTEDPNGYLLKQMQDEGIEWAVINTEWFSDYFMWWMIQDWRHSLKYWNRPDEELLNTHISKMFLELKPYIVYESLNPWQAPDNNYLVVKVPSKKPFKEFPPTQSKFDPLQHLFLYSNGGM